MRMLILVIAGILLPTMCFGFGPNTVLTFSCVNDPAYCIYSAEPGAVKRVMVRVDIDNNGGQGGSIVVKRIDIGPVLVSLKDAAGNQL